MKDKNEKKVMGRPREHNREQIAIDIVEWAKKDDSINLCKFCAYYETPIPPSKLTNWAKEDDNFRQAYETAKLFLGARREELLNAELLHVKAYDLNARTYDYFLKEEEDIKKEAELSRQVRLKELESKLKSQENKDVSEQTQNSFNALMRQLDALQSDRNMADNNISSD
jgi:hypothetical protein